MGGVAANILEDPGAIERLRGRLVQIAWFRYRIPESDAADVTQTAFLAYLEVRRRYPVAAEHGAILVGIFRKKCLEHIARSVREKRRLKRYCESPDAARQNPWIRPLHAARSPSVLDELAVRETGRQILEAIAGLRPGPRRIASLIAHEGYARQDLLSHFGLNANTLDSRLRSCRLQLRGLLRRSGIAG